MCFGVSVVGFVPLVDPGFVHGTFDQTIQRHGTSQGLGCSPHCCICATGRRGLQISFKANTQNLLEQSASGWAQFYDLTDSSSKFGELSRAPGGGVGRNIALLNLCLPFSDP